jgi:hypothetical protein
LDRIFDINPNSGSAPDCSSLEQALAAQASEQQKKKQTEIMLEAHEALCKAAPENVLRFKNVLDFLRQELHYETPPKYAGQLKSPASEAHRTHRKPVDLF